MMKTILTAGLLGLGSVASAKPVYLTCSLGSESWSISLNEEAGTLSYTRTWDDKKTTETETASYMPDFVSWGTSGILTTEHKIDRSNLKFSRSYTVGNNAPMTREGICKIAPAKKRAF